MYIYNNTPRDDGYVGRLKKFIAEKYDIDVVAMVPAKRGYYGETWRIETSANFYFAKLDYFPRHQKKFQNSLPVVEHLCENGIDFINRIVKTREGELSTRFESAVLGVFEWIDGENVETDETKTPEYQMLCKIYPLTKSGFEIPTLAFSDKMAVHFWKKWETLKAAPADETTDAVRLLFERHYEKMLHCGSRLSHFALRCRMDTSHFYITHGDAGGNFLIGKGRYSIVDWDEVMYAPLERDAWVMCCRDWALALFNKTLERNRIAYQLRPERLAFYCYYMYFYYLGEFIDDLAFHDTRKKIEDYFSWIEERIHFADTL